MLISFLFYFVAGLSNMDKNAKFGIVGNLDKMIVPLTAWTTRKYTIAGLVSACVVVAIFIGVASAQSKTAQSRASFTAAQADRGKESYAASCMDCHGANLDDGEFGGAPLKGTAFRAKWFKGPVSSLFAFTAGAMPPDRPGRLPAETYSDIVAYLLSRNGVSPGEAELPADLTTLNTLTVLL
jgi:mono/diheme cytochrome c family protein